MHELQPPLHLREENLPPSSQGHVTSSAHQDATEPHPSPRFHPTIGLTLDEEESAVIQHPAARMNPSENHNINWALTYSSDEESRSPQPAAAQETLVRTLPRSYSDPALENDRIHPLVPLRDTSCGSGPRQRSRSNCSHSEEEEWMGVQQHQHQHHHPATWTQGEEKMHSRRNSTLWTTRLRQLILCTPVRWLSVLFVLTFYTTFWLPYPGVRPAVQPVVIPKFKKLGKQPVRKGIQPAMFHALASPEVELKYRPGLEQYYQQQGFSNHAWSKYTNMTAMGMVLCFFLFERRRRMRSGTTVGQRQPLLEEEGGEESV